MVEQKIAEKQHTIFPATLKGDTLVVVPTGPLSQFSHSQVRAEIRRVKNLLQQDSIKNLIVDLSSSKYFGTAIIGTVMEFKEEFAEGQTVMCGISDDMAIAVELCQLQDAVPIYPTQQKALREISHIPLSDRFLPRGEFFKYLTALSLLAMLVTGVWATKLHYKILGSPVVTDYKALQKVWIESQTPDLNHSIEQEAKMLADEMRTIKEIEKSIALKGVSRDYTSVRLAAQSLSLVIKQKDFNGRASSSFLHNMHAARVNLKKRTSLVVPPIKRINVAAERAKASQLTALAEQRKLDQQAGLDEN